MLKHFNIVTLFLLALFVLLYQDQTTVVPIWWYVLIVVLFLCIEFNGAAYIQSGFHINAVCKINTSENVVALSFDDGPHSNTEKILEVLDKHQVKATFFCIGKNIVGQEHLVKKTFAAGHTLGNHSFSHGHFFDLKNTNAMEEDLVKAEERIKKEIGKKPLYFRPPYGVTTPALAKAIKKLNYHCIGWSIRSLDTKGEKYEVVLERIQKKLKPGSIILLHDTMDGTAELTDQLLSWLKEKNYKVVSLPDMLKKPAYA